MTDQEQKPAASVANIEPARARPSSASLMRLAAALSAARAKAGASGRWRRAISDALLPVLSAAGTLGLLAGLALLPGPFGPAHLVLIGAAALLLLAVHQVGILARRRAALQPRRHDRRFEDLCETLERRLEQLQDVHWEISETDVRYRDLLDQQSDVILRRDSEGRLTFVNSAFARVFAIAAKDALGKPFHTRAVATEAIPPVDLGEPDRGHRYIELIETAKGPRWYAWDEHDVAAADGSGNEVQAVGRDITEECLRATELAEARDLSEQANRAKSRFLAAMSHEIRTPMNGILGMASLLRETELSEEQRTYIAAVDQSARVLLALIDEILDFSKIEAGKVMLAETPFSLAEAAQSVVELLSPRAHEKGLELALTIDPGAERTLIGDEARIRQILLNLLSNAVKFTDQGGISVAIDARPHPGRAGALAITIAVEDSGIGLSPEDMQRLFLEFEQADSAQRRDHGGTGLGLAISKRLARAMGGDLRATSTPGRGSVFTAEIVLREAARNDFASVDATVMNESQLHVLIAMDHAFERRSIAHMLRCAGHAVIEAEIANAATVIASAAAAQQPIDRVIIDVGCNPGLAGDLLKAARTASRGNVIGIVTVNVLARSSLAEFRRKGYQRYLIRPVRARSLLQQLSAGLPAPAPAAIVPDQATAAAPAASQAGEPQAARTIAGGINVLLVEDNEINALLARRVLEKCGCHVEHCVDGASSVASAQEASDGRRPPFDLILMDIHLPGLDGIETARQIRSVFSDPVAGRNRPCPPIIALTANAFPEDRERYLGAGLDDYLSKPFDIEDLEAVLRAWAPHAGAPSPGARSSGAAG